MRIVKVELPNEKSYEIYIQNGFLTKHKFLPEQITVHSKVRTFAIITDENVSPLYEKIVAEVCINGGFNVISFAIPPGEKSKNATQYFALQSWLAENQVTRSDIIIALGGGVVGDLAGFTAATYLRGMQFVQIPTTLLAMVDSSVGGKTGIDIPQGKNLVGAFHQPKCVICDPQTLTTLKPETFADGCAEAIKHGMLRSEKLLKILGEDNFSEKLPEIIEENVKIKRDIVQRDQFDTGERQLLNFGHTIGHALEKLSGYELSHGNAVAVGMSIITRAAVKKSLCPPECQTILENLLQKTGLPIKNTAYSPASIYKASLTDKKRAGSIITEVIPRGLGNCELQEMPVSDLLDWIETGF